ncbi:Alpha/Beta hydrolase protein, partial [Trametes meyenii]
MSTLELQVFPKFVELSTGSRLYTERWQIGAVNPTRTLVFLHGLGASSGLFFPTIKPLLSLLPDTHVITYDHAGAGLSPPVDPSVSLSVSHMLADLEGLLAAEVSNGQIVLIAHSAGTILAARWLL